MINLSTVAKKLHHPIRLSKSFRADLSWWSVFLESWNGVSVLKCVVRGPPAFTLTSDASGGRLHGRLLIKRPRSCFHWSMPVPFGGFNGKEKWLDVCAIMQLSLPS